MKQPLRTSTLIAGAFALATIGAGATADTTHSGGGSYTTGGGQSGTYERHSTRSGSGEGTTREQAITTPSGKTYSRSANTAYDPNTGTVNRTVTGPGGGTHTTSGSYDKETGSVNISGSGPRGKEGSIAITPNR